MISEPIAQGACWPSPISSAMVARSATPLESPRLDGEFIYWIEARPNEGGRAVVVRGAGGEETADVTPTMLSVRSRVHEYGGGAYLVADGTVYVSNFSDNRVYQITPGSRALALTPDSGERFADFVFDARHARLIAVREDHRQGAGEPLNSLVSIALDGSRRLERLAFGRDFYSTPCLAPDGKALAWLAWDHPQMPWNGTELWVARIGPDGSLGTPEHLAGGATESLFQPSWSPTGQLYVISDRSGWWNLYRVDSEGLCGICPMEAEFGRAQWTLGMSTYGFLGTEHILAAYSKDGASHLVAIELATGFVESIETPYTEIESLVAQGVRAVMLAGSPSIPMEIVEFSWPTRRWEPRATSLAALPDAADLSIPRTLNYPSQNGRTVHAFHYPPAHRQYKTPSDTSPPLVVISHGGPTSRSTNVLKLSVQFWTSRGFSVLDVNYGGSSGFGRAYRDLLQGSWGIVDVEDCIMGARHLVETGRAQSQRMAIRGGSAGGFTTLSALTFHRVFQAGASYYGVSDLEALDRDTHKFESRYTSYLVGDEAVRATLYGQRSPIHHVDRLSCPIIFFQGSDDKVVPPAQSEVMVNALRERGVAVAYLLFEGEGHGFRSAEHIERSLEAELYFYCRVLGLDLPAGIEPIEIDNLEGAHTKRVS